MRIAVVIPALNEERSLPHVLGELPASLVDEVVVVDNGSTDRTPEVARECGASVIYEPRAGYGQACLTGIAALDANPPDIVVFVLDDVGSADLEAVSTPNIDALAAAGASFRRAYAHAWCAPTRSSLIFGWWDGRYHGSVCGPTGHATVDPERVSKVREELPSLKNRRV